MEFNEKLQELRKQKGITQEELAEALFVSRTAISKWESGRGYPNIESLKAIAKFFSVTIDELLSGEEILTIAEKDSKEKESYFCDAVFGLLDLSGLMFFFIPLFGQKITGQIYEVTLLSLTGISPFLKALYLFTVCATIIVGVLTLAFQNSSWNLWRISKRKLSLILNAIGVMLFVVSLQPYAATLAFIFLIIKGAMLIKRK